MIEQYAKAHEEARKRFLAEPSKCYQRHIREVWAEWEPHIPIASLKEAKVEQITRSEAESIILKYEWLAGVGTAAPMGRGISAYYGLKLNGGLLGASCWGRMGGAVGNICGEEFSKQTVCLMRGACVAWADTTHVDSKGQTHTGAAASAFTSRACKQAYKDFGWEIMFAYSDTTDAGEMGTVYQACNWYYLGEGIGSNVHTDFLSPDKKRRITSYQLNHQGEEYPLMRSLGWTPEDGEMRPWLDLKGWTRIVSPVKKKWAWFEGSRKEFLKSKCRHPFLPYPKRSAPCTSPFVTQPQIGNEGD